LVPTFVSTGEVPKTPLLLAGRFFGVTVDLSGKAISQKNAPGKRLYIVFVKMG